ASNGYAPPLDDIEFALARHGGLAAPGSASDPDEFSVLLGEAGKFVADVLAPLNRIGDRQGCRLDDDRVILPDGFRAAYRRFVDAGWGSLDVDPDYGRGRVPTPVAAAGEEMLTAANLAFS